jgi:hypothetical protein
MAHATAATATSASDATRAATARVRGLMVTSILTVRWRGEGAGARLLG